jgi:hypothetical protein
MDFTHRNLKTGTSLLALVLQIFLEKEHLINNWLISALDKGTIFTKKLFTSQNRVEIS